MMSYTVWNQVPKIPVVAHVPHSSRTIPPDVRNQFVLKDNELEEELRHVTDWFTDELFDPLHAGGGFVIRHDISPVVVDPERFVDDRHEPMSRCGMGVIYHCGHRGQVIRRALTETERTDLLERYYFPYHNCLVAAVERAVELFGRCTVVNCHSHGSEAVPSVKGHHPTRTDIVLGTDPMHTRPVVIECAERLAKVRGWSFAVDVPYRGASVPHPYRGDGRVSAFMVEIRKGLYMDEAGLKKTGAFDDVRDFIADITAASCEW